MKVKLLVFLIFLSSCGLYKSPIAPEYFAPKEIIDFKVSQVEEEVMFTWFSPELDNRKEKLRYMDGYLVLRKGPSEKLKELDKESFEDVLFIKDTHLIVERELKDKAILEGKLSRKIRADDELRSFSYSASDLIDSMYYYFQIIPINQGSIRGGSSDLVQIKYDKEKSRISMISKTEQALMEREEN